MAYFILSKLQHEFHIFYNYTEWSLLSSREAKFSEFQNLIKLNCSCGLCRRCGWRRAGRRDVPTATSVRATAGGWLATGCHTIPTAYLTDPPTTATHTHTHSATYHRYRSSTEVRAQHVKIFTLLLFDNLLGSFRGGGLIFIIRLVKSILVFVN